MGTATMRNCEWSFASTALAFSEAQVLGSSIKVWVESTLQLDETDADVAWGAVGLGG
jgi:hypothetical protein